MQKESSGMKMVDKELNKDGTADDGCPMIVMRGLTIPQCK